MLEELKISRLTIVTVFEKCCLLFLVFYLALSYPKNFSKFFVCLIEVQRFSFLFGLALTALVTHSLDLFPVNLQ